MSPTSEYTRPPHALHTQIYIPRVNEEKERNGSHHHVPHPATLHTSNQSDAHPANCPTQEKANIPHSHIPHNSCRTLPPPYPHVHDRYPHVNSPTHKPGDGQTPVHPHASRLQIEPYSPNEHNASTPELLTPTTGQHSIPRNKGIYPQHIRNRRNTRLLEKTMKLTRQYFPGTNITKPHLFPL